jgi:protein-tyrosine phosphatase
MGRLTLDRSAGCVNFRDVGEFVNTIAGTGLLPEGRLLRGGSIEAVQSLEEIGRPRTIVNFRAEPDPERFAARYIHVPSSGALVHYDVQNIEVQTWLRRAVASFAAPELRFPVMVHCLSGKDRTGVVTAALLAICGVAREVIAEEYALSEGDIYPERLAHALEALEPLGRYFRRVDIAQIRRRLMDP